MNLRLITLRNFFLLLLGVLVSSSVFSQSQLNVSAATIDFGAITMGKTGGHKLKLTNAGGGTAITVSSLAVAGANAGDFVVFGETVPFSIPAGGSVNLLVTFDPGSADPKSANLTVGNNGATGAQAVNFLGEGCTVIANPDPDADAPALEQGSKVVVEIESVDPPAGQGWTWNEFTGDMIIDPADTIINGPADTTFFPADTTFYDHTYYCAGLNYTVEGGGGVFGILDYEIQINNPGIYKFTLHSRQGENINDTTKLPAFVPATNEENDVWMRIPNPTSTALAVQGNTPGVDQTVDLGNDWFKVYKGSLGWDDNTVTVEEDAHLVFIQFTEPNVYNIQFSVRSINFCMDKFLLYDPTKTWADIEDPNIDPSPPSLPCGDVDWFFDGDEDGYGDAALRFFAIDQPFGFVDNNIDCDDASNLATPGLTEVEDGIDNNCNGFVDEGFPAAVGPCTEQRFNAGYESAFPLTTLDGRVFLADNGILKSSSDKNTINGLAVANTEDDELYQTVRTGSLAGPIEYEIPVTNGAYTVILHFAEVYHGVITDPDEVFDGRRIFDVSIEGDMVLNDYDIFADADSQATATSQTVTGVVNDGLMNLVFSPVFDGPAINAFELIPQVGCGESSPFPVEWLHFEGIRTSESVELSWVTASEVNNSYFMVERSLDVRVFEQIGRVGAQKDIVGQKSYQFSDANALQLGSYYRLKQVDINGDYSYSPIIEIAPELAAVKVYPNPLTNGANLHLILNQKRSSRVKIHLLNSLGQVVYADALESSTSNFEQEIELPQIETGYYLLRIMGDNINETKKLLIVR